MKGRYTADYLQDILNSIDEIGDFVKDMSFDGQ